MAAVPLTVISLWLPAAHAAALWSSGFETNSLSEWDYELNPEGLSVVTDPVAAGQYALRAELTSETVWDNGIFRTELQYKPTKSRVSEGAETYFGWSIYLPAPLPAGDYQLGYYETGSTYNQVFSLHAEGADVALYVNHRGEGSPHKVAGVLTTGAWHRIVYHVKWSADPAIGFVDLWWDGVKVVTQAKGETFVDDDPAVIQLGLLKNPPAPPQAVVLYVDEAIDGEAYADVSLGIAEAVPSVEPTTSAPPLPSATASTDSSLATAATTTTAAATSSAPTSTAPTTSAPSAKSNSGCSVGVGSPRPLHSEFSWLAVCAGVGLLVLRGGQAARRPRVDSRGF